MNADGDGTKFTCVHQRRASVPFETEDPAGIGLLKLTFPGDKGGFALTTADSVDRYNVGTRPNLTMMKLVINGAETDGGQAPYTLYRYVPIDPALLKTGANALTVSGVYWFQLAAPMPAPLLLEPPGQDKHGLAPDQVVVIANRWPIHEGT
jgi:hypothetical protein